MKPKSELILYQTEDNRTRIEVRLENETVWLSLNQMAELFQTTKQNVSLHIQNIYAEGELRREATVKEYLTVQKEGSREVSRSLEHYNLDVIISVGYRVKSHRGTQFRIWATQRLREYIVKGFTLDDERLKQGGTKNEYFDGLYNVVDYIDKLCALLSTPGTPGIPFPTLPLPYSPSQSIFQVITSSPSSVLLRSNGLKCLA
jgi:hypothetical protein